MAKALLLIASSNKETSMKRIFTTAAALVILAGTGAAYAQPGHDDHHDNHDNHGGSGMMMHGPAHANWHQGGRIERNDWNRGQHIDYRAHHLRRPPHGYEWRQVDGNYVLAAAATGLIASILLANQ
jgi:Ni/Co efflux regulator RcnB